MTTKRTRKRTFLSEMNRVVPWAALVGLMAPFAPEGKRSQPLFSVETMLRVQFVQQWFAPSFPAMDDGLHDTPVLRAFAALDIWTSSISDTTAMLRLRALPETHRLVPQIHAVIDDLFRANGMILLMNTVIRATLIAATRLSENSRGKYNSDMHQRKMGTQWNYGSKAHIEVGAESGRAHTVHGTSININDVVAANALRRGEESEVFATPGYQGARKRADVQHCVSRTVAMHRRKRAALDKAKRVERLKSCIRAKVDHRCEVIMRRFSDVSVRYRRLKTNTA